MITSSQHPRTAVISCMRDEGPFVVEWVAYLKALGFDDIVVATNDCTDGTDSILDELARLGVVTHLRNNVGQDETPQEAGLQRLLAHPAVRDKDWVLHCDADEFICLTGDHQTIETFVSQFEDADVIALLWRCFGDSGIRYWRGGSVLRTFTRTIDRPLRRHIFHKSMFRPQKFGSATDHMPKNPKTRDIRLVNAIGHPLQSQPLFRPKRSRYDIMYRDCTWQNACINHYAIRAQDVFLMKNFRGDGMGGEHRKKYMIGSVFYQRTNRNEVENLQIMRHVEQTDAVINDLMQSTTLRRLDKAALDAFCARRDVLLTPEKFEEWTLSA